MPHLDSLSPDFSDRALDVVEQTLLAANWACERSEDGMIHCAAMTKWGEFGGMFAWRDEPASLNFSLTLDLRAPHAKQSSIADLLRRINERLWLGHFDLWSQDGIVMYRNALVLAGGGTASDAQCEALLNTALDACERYFPAYQFVVWAGKSAREALDAAMFETQGRA